jgi:hypothetical protein
MKIVRAGFLGAAVVASALMFFAPPAGADSPTPCADSFLSLPVSASLVPQGEQKDHNGNGIVCAKYQDGKFVGGPDDTTDDIVL